MDLWLYMPRMAVSPSSGVSVRSVVTVVPLRHEIRVLATVPEAVHDGAPLRVQSPTWVPGDYSFQTFGRDVFALQAHDTATGEPLAVRRVDWQGYAIDAAAGDVEFSYVAYCTSWDRSEACGILGDDAGVLTGARYLWLPDHDGPYDVEYVLPDGWAIHHPSGASRLAEAAWRYPSYEILLDTPVSLGGFEIVSREVDGTPFFYVFLDRGIGSATAVEEFVDQVEDVVRSFGAIFGGFPFEDYTFICSLNSNAEWGLEHLTSTMVGLGPDVFADADQHAVGVRVCAHEFFHAWNVRRLRPATLGHLDFAHGSFTEGLWVAEGFTRYYEFLSCTRTGVYTPQQFLSTVVNYYRHLAALSAYERVSPIDSSQATFLNHDDKYSGRVNNAIDYYDAGMVIAFGIDAALRTRTSTASLDTAFAAFYDRFAGRGAGYTPADLCDFLDELLPGLGAATMREVSEPGALALVEHLQTLGFEVGTEEVPFLGLLLLGETGPQVYGVLDTSPAGASGIAPEDTIVAVGGLAFELEGLRWAIEHQPSVELDVMRGNGRRSYAIAPGRCERIAALTWKGTAEQAEVISTWVGQPFAPTPDESIPLDFYENFHGIETVI
jgi:predicted metalloprotease with PDZ domain